MRDRSAVWARILRAWLLVVDSGPNDEALHSMAQWRSCSCPLAANRVARVCSPFSVGVPWKASHAIRSVPGWSLPRCPARAAAIRSRAATKARWAVPPTSQWVSSVSAAATDSDEVRLTTNRLRETR